MEIPNHMNPLYELSGCLDHEPVPFKCLECDEWLPLEEMSDTPGVCHECDTLEHIINLMRRKRKSLIADFGNLMTELHKEPDWESMLIHKNQNHV